MSVLAKGGHFEWHVKKLSSFRGVEGEQQARAHLSGLMQLPASTSLHFANPAAASPAAATGIRASDPTNGVWQALVTSYAANANAVQGSIETSSKIENQVVGALRQAGVDARTAGAISEHLVGSVHLTATMAAVNGGATDGHLLGARVGAIVEGTLGSHAAELPRGMAKQAPKLANLLTGYASAIHAEAVRLTSSALQDHLGAELESKMSEVPSLTVAHDRTEQRIEQKRTHRERIVVAEQQRRELDELVRSHRFARLMV